MRMLWIFFVWIKKKCFLIVHTYCTYCTACFGNDVVNGLPNFRSCSSGGPKDSLRVQIGNLRMIVTYWTSIKKNAAWHVNESDLESARCKNIVQWSGEVSIFQRFSTHASGMSTIKIINSWKLNYYFSSFHLISWLILIILAHLLNSDLRIWI